MAEQEANTRVAPWRSVMLAMVLGFHNAFEQEEASLETVAAHHRQEYRAPVLAGLDDPARCYFWGESPLLN